MIYCCLFDLQPPPIPSARYTLAVSSIDDPLPITFLIVCCGDYPLPTFTFFLGEASKT